MLVFVAQATSEKQPEGVRPEPLQLAENVEHDIVCQSTEHGIGWLRVRSYFRMSFAGVSLFKRFGVTDTSHGNVAVPVGGDREQGADAKVAANEWDVADPEAELARVALAATQTRAALQADPAIPTEALVAVENGRLQVRCRVGKAALLLSRCLEAEVLTRSGEDRISGASSSCTVGNMVSSARLLLGLSEVLPLHRAVRTGWPVHLLLLATINSLRLRASRLPSAPSEVTAASDAIDRHLRRRRLLSLLGVAAAEGFPGGMYRELADALQPSCVHRPPFDALFCAGLGAADTKLTGDGTLATAASFLAQAWARTRRGPPSELAEQVCVATGSQRLCPKRVLDGESEDIITRASLVLSEAFVQAVRPLPFMNTLIDSPWPLLEMLTILSDELSGRRHDWDRETSNAHRGICGCEVDGWAAREVSSVAAALRQLRRLRELDGDLDAIVALARSPESDIACFGVPPHRNSSGRDGQGVSPESLRKMWTTSAALAVVRRIWGVVPLYYKEVSTGKDSQRRVLTTLEWLHAAGPEDFDAGICVPGALAVATYCSLVALDRNAYSLSIELYVASEVLLMGAMPCATPLSNTPRDAKAQGIFENDWEALVRWIREPSRFIERVWAPLMASNRWWQGEGSSDGWPSESPPKGEAARGADHCAGVPHVSSKHACRLTSVATAMRHSKESPGAAEREEDSRNGIDQRKNRLPKTRVFGVGPMKSGSTAVIQVLAAATKLKFGFDCFRTSHDPIILRVLRREESLHELIESCDEDLFTWELAKDPTFTPLALRLADIWPPISSHGQQLKLYFVVRNPFANVLSLVDHLRLPLPPNLTSGEDEVTDGDGGQNFTLEAIPNAGRFSRGKQLYLDVTRDGLRYTGYVDAVTQRWALMVDVYLACTARFALVRHEDFVADPIRTTWLLLQQLGLSHLWDGGPGGSADRVTSLASVPYQNAGHSTSRGNSLAEFERAFGSATFSRIKAAVASRAVLLGYGALLSSVAMDALLAVATEGGHSDMSGGIHMPPLPEAASGCSS
eukprot:TRINITY_DN60741_c0_g1_i1.p1 TRINITY_DN60741_c0_g1~~TRINITY_DN60741_c0_g1_i1.p1  ORF type:complete len:1142 (+),score=161.66 TRINITY_DN60741_c0_g1_i1:350-3427(+)